MTIPKLFVGIDPGVSGAYAVLHANGDFVSVVKGSESCHDRYLHLRRLRGPSKGVFCFALLEKVHAMPGQGVSSTFKFGESYGQAEAILECLRIPYETITPAKWQTEMKCRTKGDKNVSKHAAQRLFPDQRIIHATADALLLAEQARRMAIERKLI